MAFDDIIRPKNVADEPVVTRIDPPPRPVPPRRRPEVEEDRVPVDAEPHFPRIFPGL